jgi:23S rRNA (adenine2503-C2)-methyltransferase
MMDGVNDTEDQAFKLAAIARRLRAHVNLIALNPTPLTTEKASAKKTIQEFADLLEGEGANVTIRDTRGKDIDAACGQLRAKGNEAPSAVPIEVRPKTSNRMGINPT